MRGHTHTFISYNYSSNYISLLLKLANKYLGQTNLFCSSKISSISGVAKAKISNFTELVEWEEMDYTEPEVVQRYGIIPYSTSHILRLNTLSCSTEDT